MELRASLETACPFFQYRVQVVGVNVTQGLAGFLVTGNRNGPRDELQE